MKRAHSRRQYRNVHEFEAPEGVITADIDAETGMLATSNCPKVRSEVFIAGTQPVEACKLHGGRTQIAGWEPASPKTESAPEKTTVAVADPAKTPARPQVRSIPITPAPPPEPEAPKKSRGFFGRLKDIFR
jgi:hypothetical protein